MNAKNLIVLKYVAYTLGAAVALYLIWSLVKAVRVQLERGVGSIGDALGNVFSEFSPVGILDRTATAFREWRQNVFGGEPDSLPPGVVPPGAVQPWQPTPGTRDYTDTSNWNL